MSTLAPKSQNNEHQSLANKLRQKKGANGSTFQFVDKRPEAIAQTKFQQTTNDSLQVKQLMRFADKANQLSPNRHKFPPQIPIQRYTDDDSASDSENDHEADEAGPAAAAAAGADHLLDQGPPVTGRFSTLYTFTHGGDEIRGNQGPHTLGDAAVGAGLTVAFEREALDGIFAQQCPTPTEWNRMALGDGVADQGRTEAPVDDRILRRVRQASTHYSEVYDLTQAAIREGNVARAENGIRRLVQLHPNAVTGWKTTRTAARSRIGGHGENRELYDPTNVATEARSYFNSREGFDEFLATRRRLARPGEIALRQVREAQGQLAADPENIVAKAKMTKGVSAAIRAALALEENPPDQAALVEQARVNARTAIEIKRGVLLAEAGRVRSEVERILAVGLLNEDDVDRRTKGHLRKHTRILREQGPNLQGRVRGMLEIDAGEIDFALVEENLKEANQEIVKVRNAVSFLRNLQEEPETSEDDETAGEAEDLRERPNTKRPRLRSSDGSDGSVSPSVAD